MPAKTVYAVCPHDCPDACGVAITVEDGRATHIQGDPEHPVTRGFLCAKVTKYLDRVYSPERVLYPMRRKPDAPKGGGNKDIRDFERITWEEALDAICAQFKQVSKDFGPEAVLPYSYGGTLGALNGESMDRRFFHRIGASQLNRTICATAGGDALVQVYGRKLGTDTEAFKHAKTIIAWGANIHGNNIHLWPFIEEARQNGARLIVIDPYMTRTARAADWYLPINPATDVALALAMMHVIIRDGLHDADYVSKYTVGFDELKKKAAEYPPEKVSGWTGISTQDIEKLAHEYATALPAVIRVNYGLQRCENGGTAVRAISFLPLLTGAWKKLGGGLQLSVSGAHKLNGEALTRPDLMVQSPLGREARTINMSALGEALTKIGQTIGVNDGPPVKMVFVYNSNPAAVAPNHNDVIKGFSRPDLFTVVHEQFLTDTTDYADIVLPATTFFEHEELQTSYGHYYLQHSKQAIAPLGECKANVDTFRALALHMGFTEACFQEGVSEMIDAALDNPNSPYVKGITRQHFAKSYFVPLGSVAGNEAKLRLPFAEGGFETKSGKAEFYSEELQAQGLDPVAAFVPPQESRHSSLARRFPLEMLARKADNFLNSTFCNLPTLQKMEPKRDLLELNVQDAAARGIQSGDRVRVFNDRGALELTAQVDGMVQPGVVASRLNWAKLTAGGRNVNVLTSEKLTDIGAGATFYSCLVEVEKA